VETGYDPAALPVPHGYELTPEARALLRSRPPAAALKWVAAAFGRGARVTSARSRNGGTSSAIHVVTVETGSGTHHRCVLRRYVRPEVQAEEPDLAAREAVALGVAATSTVATPELIAVDPTGDEVGVPAVLMTLVPGRIEWAPADLDRFLDRLVEPVLAIAAVDIPAGIHIPAYYPYPATESAGAPHTTQLPQRVWDTAFALLAGPPPVSERRFIHRDYHPGNVLWRRGVVSGVVDWQAASLGSPEADIGHCRANLDRHFGAQVADRFLARWQRDSGRSDYHPYWDVSVVLSFVGAHPGPDPWLDHFVGTAVARL
jgi:aminoglycoside phosphotransferase (APT) family kinase protein